MTYFMWSLSCHGYRWEHGMMYHDHGMSIYDMSCLNTGCLVMTVGSCPCITCHGICMKDVPYLCHHTCPRGHGGLLGGQVWGGAQHQKSCGINFNKFLHKNISNKISKGILTRTPKQLPNKVLKNISNKNIRKYIK